MPKKRAKKATIKAAPAADAPEVLFHVKGKMSTFGGPLDFGMKPDEDVALFAKADLTNPKFSYLFLPSPPPGTSGLGRRLNPDEFYFACRWDYAQTSKQFLRNTLATIENPKNGKSAEARPVDWGPNEDTGRDVDLSPGLAAALGLNTDDNVSVTIEARRAIAVKAARRAGHGTSNPNAKPPIQQFIQSPNYSSRNGSSIEKIVLHCTEASLQSTLDHFQTPGGRNPVSAHYVIDRNGDIYQLVSESDAAWHCMGANRDSIGIEHVGKETDALTAKQSDSSAALIRWLLAQYHIPRENIFGHDFTPGYNRPGGTSCPDELFGPTHSQAAVAAWVKANV